jgi:hypothetical protein
LRNVKGQGLVETIRILSEIWLKNEIPDGTRAISGKLNGGHIYI